MSGMGSFKHRALDLHRKTIRLISVLPNLSRQGYIQCTVHHDTIDASYDCLSYTWGPPAPLQTIVMDNETFTVRQNLYDFLESIRSRPDAPQKIFIDALSIDQENILERNHQVAQMGHIYSNAETVRVWLGPLREIQDIICALQTVVSASGQEWQDINDFVWSKRLLIGEHPFANEYWNRAWVTQELVLARRAVVSTAVESIDLSLLLKSLRQIRLTSWYETGFVQYAGLESRKRKFHRESIVSLMNHFKDKNCSVPCDRAFSLLSLCTEGQGVKVDYDLPASDLAYNILDLSSTPLCLCSALLVARGLGVNEYYSGQKDANRIGPVLEIDLLHLQSHGEPRMIPGVGKGFLINLADMREILEFCPAFKGLRHSVLNVSSSPMVLQRVIDITWNNDGHHEIFLPVEGFRFGNIVRSKIGCTLRIGFWAMNIFGSDKIQFCMRPKRTVPYSHARLLYGALEL